MDGDNLVRPVVRGLGISHNTVDCHDRLEILQPHKRDSRLWKIKTKICEIKGLAVSKKRAFLSPSEQWTLYQNVVSSSIYYSDIFSS